MSDKNAPAISMKDFRTISSELFREYHFKDYVLRIEDPVLLHVSANGHRIVDSKNKSYYVPNGWYCIQWQSREGFKPFEF